MVACFECSNRQRIPGDAHIRCNDPVKAVLTIGAGGNERYKIAEVAVKASLEKGVLIAVRCIWPGSGLFPISFDGGTVYACANFKEGKPSIRSIDTIGDMAKTLRMGIPPVIGHLNVKLKKVK